MRPYRPRIVSERHPELDRAFRLEKALGDPRVPRRAIEDGRQRRQERLELFDIQRLVAVAPGMV